MCQIYYRFSRRFMIFIIFVKFMSCFFLIFKFLMQIYCDLNQFLNEKSIHFNKLFLKLTSILKIRNKKMLII